MVVPPAIWLIGLGLATVQLLMRMGAAACAGPIDAVIAAAPMTAVAIARPKRFMRVLLPQPDKVSRWRLSLTARVVPAAGTPFVRPTWEHTRPTSARWPHC